MARGIEFYRIKFTLVDEQFLLPELIGARKLGVDGTCGNMFKEGEPWLLW